MAVINGYEGSVTFASGYTTSAHAWSIRATHGSLDTTGFAPTSNYRTRVAGIGEWSGAYMCWARATANTTLSAGATAYVSNPFRYDVTIGAEALDATAFTAAWKAVTVGLLDAKGSYECYVDDTTALPVTGTADTLTFTLITGATYAIPLIITSVDTGVSAAGDRRTVSIGFESTGVVVATGAGAPVAGTSGAATLTADTGRTYSGNILITGVRIAKSADREQGEFTFDFAGNGTLTGA